MAYKKIADEDKAIAIIVMQAAGYPDRSGALRRAGKETGISTRTLRRYWLDKDNPIVDNLVTPKKGTIIEKLDSVIHMILDSFDMDTINEAELRERATALGIVIDKMQILTGGPTENVNQQILMKWAE